MWFIVVCVLGLLCFGLFGEQPELLTALTSLAHIAYLCWIKSLEVSTALLTSLWLMTDLPAKQGKLILVIVSAVLWFLAFYSGSLALALTFFFWIIYIYFFGPFFTLFFLLFATVLHYMELQKQFIPNTGFQTIAHSCCCSPICHHSNKQVECKIITYVESILLQQ